MANERNDRRDSKGSRNQAPQHEDGFIYDKVITINRVAKVVKGGRRFSFAALVVIGDQQGKIGIGLGKASEVPEAIKKAGKKARKNVVTIKRKGSTIPHTVLGAFGAGSVLMKPAKEGTGVIASGVVRSLIEAAGIKNVVCKSLGSNNSHNVVRATVDGLKQLFDEADVKRLRG